MKLSFPFNTFKLFSVEGLIYSYCVQCFNVVLLESRIWGKAWSIGKKKERVEMCYLFFKQLVHCFSNERKKGTWFLTRNLLDFNVFIPWSWLGAHACKRGLGPASSLAQMQVVRKLLCKNRIILVEKLMKDPGWLFLKRGTFAEREIKRV